MLIRTIAIAFGLMGAVAASQLPEFLQQYRQRLGGAVDELTRVVTRFDADAAENNVTRDEALRKLAQSPDDLTRRRASDAEANIHRLQSLETQKRAMDDEDSIARVAYFLRYPDRDLTRATARDFRPAVPTTGEGLFSGSLGFIAGWGFVQLVGWPWRRWREQRTRRMLLR